ncbi:hypothetical protein GCM10010199_54080 [Dactylosporangium roseum]
MVNGPSYPRDDSRSVIIRAFRRAGTGPVGGYPTAGVPAFPPRSAPRFEQFDHRDTDAGISVTYTGSSSFDFCTIGTDSVL